MNFGVIRSKPFGENVFFIDYERANKLINILNLSCYMKKHKIFIVKLSNVKFVLYDKKLTPFKI